MDWWQGGKGGGGRREGKHQERGKGRGLRARGQRAVGTRAGRGGQEAKDRKGDRRGKCSRLSINIIKGLM